MYPRHFEYHVIKHWILFKSCEEYLYFCFSRLSTWLDLACKLQTIFCRLWLQPSLVFRCFVVELDICCACAPSSCLSGVWVVVCLLAQFTFLGMLVKIRSIYTCSSVVRYRVQKQHKGVPSLGSSLSCLSGIFCFFGSPGFVLWVERLCFSYPLPPYHSVTQPTFRINW